VLKKGLSELKKAPNKSKEGKTASKGWGEAPGRIMRKVLKEVEADLRRLTEGLGQKLLKAWKSFFG
jgi:hypothetical protein